MSDKKNKSISVDPLHYFILGIFIIYPIAILTKWKAFFIYIAFLFCLIIINALVNDRNFISILTDNKLVVLLFFSFYISSFWSIDPRKTLAESFFITIFLVTYFIMFYYVSYFPREKILDFFILIPLFLLFIDII